MQKRISIRGMHDLLGNSYDKQEKVIQEFVRLAKLNNFFPISTPIMERNEVFSRGLGNSSDIVMKEMYSLKDKNDELLTLRPEGTAGIARAVLSNSLEQSLPLKFYYHGPMFRYERPQKGRLRQFNQLGVEIFSNGHYLDDILGINFAYNFLRKLDISNNLILSINTLGKVEERKNFIQVLKTFFKKRKNDLSKDSIRRLELNPLRILDSKDDNDKEVCKEAPIIYDFLSQNDLDYFEKIKQSLDAISIKYITNPYLVRGLDYYNDTIFEFVLKNNRNFAVLAGGRYDNLVGQLGGKNLPGFGWAAGIERLRDLSDFSLKKSKAIVITSIDESNAHHAYKIANILVNDNFKIDIFINNLKKALKYSNKIHASYTIILGDEELKKESLGIKNMQSGEQQIVKIKNLQNYLKKL